MLKNLKENELEVATKLIFDGLSMAKASMEQILQSPITIKKIDYGHEQLNGIPRLYETDEKIHLIKTVLKGELKGISYLIFSEGEVNKVCNACLPATVLDDESPEGKMMKMGFLTEIDNMVAAAVITEFSNFLDLDIFGDVPSLQVLNANEVSDRLEQESTDFDSVIHFKAIFHGTELDISPDFVWIFHDELVTRIKEAV